MPKDRFFRRRMAINKFNNRPPFDVKKSDDSTSVENKEQNSSNPHFPPNCEANIVNSAAKAYRNVVKYFEEIDGRYQHSVKNKNKNIIPKIIESFQKVTPKKQPKLIKRSQKTDSLHTLYRNNTNFGKNIPDHKLMKNLLQGCDSDNTNVPILDTYSDVIPSKDINTSRTMKYADGDIRNRIDKQTSTTGLVWPITSDKSQLNLKTSKSIPCNRNVGKTRSRIPQIRSMHTEKTYVNSKPLHSGSYCENKQVLSNSELEYFPTKDSQNLHCSKKMENLSKFTDKQNIHFINGVNKEFPQYKFNGKQDGLKKEQTYVVHVDNPRNNPSNENSLGTEKRKKEKSFVQVQVDKYNKINGKGLRSKGHVSNNSLKHKNFQETRKNVTKNYIDIMAAMRETLPNLGDKCVDATDNHDWSDNVETDHEVKFPKETRNAMENLKMENSRRIPLTKYSKSQNIQIQPAIPTVDLSKSDHGEDKKHLYKKINQLPCSKNLLCSRGPHEGPCKLEKGPPPRFEPHKVRPKFVK